MFPKDIDVFAHTVMGRNTSSRRRVFTGGSKQGGVSEITRKNSNTIIRVIIIIIIIYYNGGNNKYEEKDNINSSSMDRNTQACKLNDWLFTLMTVVLFPVTEVFFFSWFLHISPFWARSSVATNFKQTLCHWGKNRLEGEASHYVWLVCRSVEPLSNASPYAHTIWTVGHYWILFMNISASQYL